VGCRHDVLQSEQRRVRARLRRVDVETGSGDPAFGHRGEQRFFIHDAATRSIDDVNSRLHLAQRFFPNEADGLRRLGQVHRDEVSIGQQLIEGDHVHTQLGRSRRLNVGVVRDQVHAERGEALGNEDPDPAEPHDADCLVRNFDAGVLGTLPLTTVQRGIRGHNVARAREQQSHRQFRGADDVGGGCVHHHDTRLGGGLDVDVV